MSVIYKFLFPMKPDGTAISLLLLALRLLGVGHSISLGLAIFGELACSIGFIFGALYRLAMIPMIFTMGMAFFVIHGNDPFSLKELAFIYLVVFILMYITGPGKFSLDRLIAVPLSRKQK